MKRKPAGSEFLEATNLEKRAQAKDLRFQQGIFDSEDPDYVRFQIKDHEVREEAIIASRQNIYIRFPILKLEASPLEKLLEEKPEYVIKPGPGRETKEAQLLRLSMTTRDLRLSKGLRLLCKKVSRVSLSRNRDEYGRRGALRTMATVRRLP